MAKTNSSDKPHFNIADIIIVIALIAVITAFALRVYNVLSKNDSTVQVRVAFEVTDVTTSEILLNKGDLLYLSEDDSLAGTLEKFEIFDTRHYAYTEDGKLVKAAIAGKSDVKGTIILDCVKTDKGYYLGGTLLLSEGDSIMMYTKNREMSFRIINITEIETDENGNEIVHTSGDQSTTGAQATAAQS